MNSKAVRKTKRKPPAKAVPSVQYDLFAAFFGDPEDLSNTIELWDAIPKYCVSARQQAARRDGTGRLQVHEHAFRYKERNCRLEVQPASLKTEGGFRDFFPSTDEELVEEVIRKVFADQRYGFHIAPAAESWVRFSLSMIRSELKARGRTRSLDEIKRSIEILSRTVISLYVEGEDDPIYTNPILSDLTRVRRKDYLEDTSSMWAARLPALVSKSVNAATYRQFHYGTYMLLPSQLARWLHKRLSHNYVYASWNKSYEILFTTLQRDSGLMQSANVTKNLAVVEAALNELKAAAVLHTWDAERRRGERNRIADVKYTMYADPEFVRQIKAANARQTEAERALGTEGRSALTPGKSDPLPPRA